MLLLDEQLYTGAQQLWGGLTSGATKLWNDVEQAPRVLRGHAIQDVPGNLYWDVMSLANTAKALASAAGTVLTDPYPYSNTRKMLSDYYTAVLQAAPTMLSETWATISDPGKLTQHILEHPLDAALLTRRVPAPIPPPTTLPKSPPLPHTQTPPVLPPPPAPPALPPAPDPLAPFYRLMEEHGKPLAQELRNFLKLTPEEQTQRRAQTFGPTESPFPGLREQPTEAFHPWNEIAKAFPDDVAEALLRNADLAYTILPPGGAFKNPAVRYARKIAKQYDQLPIDPPRSGGAIAIEDWLKAYPNATFTFHELLRILDQLAALYRNSEVAFEFTEELLQRGLLKMTDLGLRVPMADVIDRLRIYMTEPQVRTTLSQLGYRTLSPRKHVWNVEISPFSQEQLQLLRELLMDSYGSKEGKLIYQTLLQRATPDNPPSLRILEELLSPTDLYIVTQQLYPKNTPQYLDLWPD